MPVIPEIALYYDGSGQHLLFVFASLCESILALRFHLHERGVVRDRWGGAPHPASTNERARKSAQPSPARGEGPTRLALLLCLGDRASRPLNSGDGCVILGIALYYDGSGRYLLFVFASLCEIILALGFDWASPRDGDNRRVPLHQLRWSPSPGGGGIRIPVTSASSPK
jgi:hypothetical protein